MGVIGASLIIASLVLLLVMYPQSWRQLAQPFLQWRGQAEVKASGTLKSTGTLEGTLEGTHKGTPKDTPKDTHDTPKAGGSGAREDRDRLAMPPPPIIRSEQPQTDGDDDGDGDNDEATTPKAVPAVVAAAIPTFSLSGADSKDGADSDSDADADDMPPPMFPSPFSAQRAGASASPVRGSMLPPPGVMLPPPRPVPPPKSAAAAARRQPALLPVPSRAPPASLAPPPSTTVQPPRPAKTGRNKVMLTPGHSPLDWARLTADPVANNLRGSGVRADAPYLLRITPSQLKRMNGRKGRDAWTALGGMVYNISPYVPFHPGGAGELLRCAGKDGSRLFNEVHSWVNYENMLAACRVGILVDEGAAQTSPMEEMD